MSNGATAFTSLTPSAVLRAAIQQVPALKYALGVGGLAAVVAIALLGWQLPPQHAILGALVVIVLMVVLVIFAALAKAKTRALQPLALVLAWSFLAVTVSVTLLFVSCAFFDRPKSLPCLVDASKCQPARTRTPSDNVVLGYMDQIAVLRGDFEARERNPGAAEKVKVEGKRLANLITGVNDAGLNPSRRVIKHEYAGWALLMVARTYPGLPNDNSQRVKYAREALDALDRSLVEAGKIQRGHEAGDVYASQDYEWLTGKSDDLNRTHYLKAIALAVLAQEKAGSSKDDVHRQLRNVSDDYLSEYPISGIPELLWASQT